ncbi:hypothetical protein KFE25_014378 [Diacronema lutheri]|uniref:Uncharacterized protein n=1 Tax=Diacronema lutheri TaxID=2081491 RepID=A0A8J6C7H9_DIALT|nr:hypothetical protein KFE25_014378 [Diacronema lutheri]
MLVGRGAALVEQQLEASDRAVADDVAALHRYLAAATCRSSAHAGHQRLELRAPSPPRARLRAVSSRLPATHARLVALRRGLRPLRGAAAHAATRARGASAGRASRTRAGLWAFVRAAEGAAAAAPALERAAVLHRLVSSRERFRAVRRWGRWSAAVRRASSRAPVLARGLGRVARARALARWRLARARAARHEALEVGAIATWRALVRERAFGAWCRCFLCASLRDDPVRRASAEASRALGLRSALERWRSRSAARGPAALGAARRGALVRAQRGWERGACRTAAQRAEQRAAAAHARARAQRRTVRALRARAALAPWRAAETWRARTAAGFTRWRDATWRARARAITAAAVQRAALVAWAADARPRAAGARRARAAAATSPIRLSSHRTVASGRTPPSSMLEFDERSSPRRPARERAEGGDATAAQRVDGGCDAERGSARVTHGSGWASTHMPSRELERAPARPPAGATGGGWPASPPGARDMAMGEGEEEDGGVEAAIKRGWQLAGVRITPSRRAARSPPPPPSARASAPQPHSASQRPGASANQQPASHQPLLPPLLPLLLPVEYAAGYAAGATGVWDAGLDSDNDGGGNENQRTRASPAAAQMAGIADAQLAGDARPQAAATKLASEDASEAARGARAQLRGERSPPRELRANPHGDVTPPPGGAGSFSARASPARAPGPDARRAAPGGEDGGPADARAVCSPPRSAGRSSTRGCASASASVRGSAPRAGAGAAATGARAGAEAALRERSDASDAPATRAPPSGRANPGGTVARRLASLEAAVARERARSLPPPRARVATAVRSRSRSRDPVGNVADDAAGRGERALVGDSSSPPSAVAGSPPSAAPSGAADGAAAARPFARRRLADARVRMAAWLGHAAAVRAAFELWRAGGAPPGARAAGGARARALRHGAEARARSLSRLAANARARSASRAAAQRVAIGAAARSARRALFALARRAPPRPAPDAAADSDEDEDCASGRADAERRGARAPARSPPPAFSASLATAFWRDRAAVAAESRRDATLRRLRSTVAWTPLEQRRSGWAWPFDLSVRPEESGRPASARTPLRTPLRAPAQSGAAAAPAARARSAPAGTPPREGAPLAPLAPRVRAPRLRSAMRAWWIFGLHAAVWAKTAQLLAHLAAARALDAWRRTGRRGALGTPRSPVERAAARTAAAAARASAAHLASGPHSPAARRVLALIRTARSIAEAEAEAGQAGPSALRARARARATGRARAHASGRRGCRQARARRPSSRRSEA